MIFDWLNNQISDSLTKLMYRVKFFCADFFQWFFGQAATVMLAFSKKLEPY